MNLERLSAHGYLNQWERLRQSKLKTIKKRGRMITKNYKTPHINNVAVVGKVTKAPDLRRTGAGKAYCSFDIAIGRRMKDANTGEWKDAEPTFVPIIAWGEQAEKCAKVQKGWPIYIEGRLQTNSWISGEGLKQSRLQVFAAKVECLMQLIQQPEGIVDESPLNEAAEANADRIVEAYENDKNSVPF